MLFLLSLFKFNLSSFAVFVRFSFSFPLFFSFFFFFFFRGCFIFCRYLLSKILKVCGFGCVRFIHPPSFSPFCIFVKIPFSCVFIFSLYFLYIYVIVLILFFFRFGGFSKCNVHPRYPSGRV
jgi:hypothetical protein